MTEQEQDEYMRERGFERDKMFGPEVYMDMANFRSVTRSSDGQRPETKRWSATSAVKGLSLFCVRWADGCETAVQAHCLAELRGWV